MQALVIDGVAHELGPLEGYVLPGGVEHAAYCGPEGALVLDVFRPVREDYRERWAAASGRRWARRRSRGLSGLGRRSFLIVSLGYPLFRRTLAVGGAAAQERAPAAFRVSGRVHPSEARIREWMKAEPVAVSADAPIEAPVTMMTELHLPAQLVAVQIAD
jgi:hypothetical protein